LDHLVYLLTILSLQAAVEAVMVTLLVVTQLLVLAVEQAVYAQP
jgi:hypothetical protein